MGLPKGAFKGLAKVLAPLCFWMAAGWAAYPYIIESISQKMGETLDMTEIDAFSAVMTIICIVTGISLAIYGFSGREASDDELKALARQTPLCPYCGSVLIIHAGQCDACRKTIPK